MQPASHRRTPLNLSRRLAGLALLACPVEYRREYGPEILADLADDPLPAFGATLEIFESGLAMHIDGFTRYVKHALARLRRSPLFVTIVLLTFALGIGANVAVFSVLHGVLLQPLPYVNPARLVTVAIYDGRANYGTAAGAISVPDFRDLRSRSRLIEDIGVETPSQGTITGSGRPRNLSGFDASPSFLKALGVKAQLGRMLGPGDRRKGVKSVVVSDKIWHEVLGGRLDAIGKTLRIDGDPYTIVGVAEPDQRIPEISSNELRKFDFIDVQPDTAPEGQRGARYLSTVGVLKPGVSLAQANAELAGISTDLQKRFPAADSMQTFKASSLSEALLNHVSSALWTVFAAVFGILLITCANVANLILANASNRDREFALRSALGASHMHIAMQLFAETAILAAAGGLLGVGLAFASLRAMIGAHLLSFPRIDEVAINGPVLLYALCAVLFATLAAGAWPMLSAGRGDLSLTLKTAGRGGDAATSNGMRSTLVVAEIAIALALVVLSSLTTRSFVQLTHSDLGIKPQGLETSDIAGLPDSRYKELAPRRMFADRLLARLRAIPGITSAATAVSYPLSDVNVGFSIGVVGRTFPPGGEPSFTFNATSSDYFKTLGIPVLRGREFSDSDTAFSLPVAVVNEAMAQQLFPGGSAVGRQIVTPGWNGGPRATRTIVGIVGNERHRLGRPFRGEDYAPVSQVAPTMLSAVVRADGTDLPTVGKEIQAAYEAADPLMEPPKTYTIADLVRDGSTEARSGAILLGALAVVALVLSLSGIFGVVSFSVSRRIREFGVRIALGARPRDILTDVLWRSTRLTAYGIAIGVAIAVAGGRVISSELYGVSALDPVTFVAAISLILACSAVAAILPALRATRMDPGVALRYE